MAVENKSLTWHISAGEALTNLNAGTGSLFKAIDLTDAQIAATSKDAGGILQQGAQSGNHATIGVSGLMKYTAAATVAAKAKLIVTTSGYLTTAGSGDQWVIGSNLETAVSSGAVGIGHFDFSVPVGFDSSSGHIATFEEAVFTTQTCLTADASKSVDLSAGDIASISAVANGVLVTGVDSGLTALVRHSGNMEVLAGGVITADQSLKVTSGWFLAADSGDVIVARAIDASAAGNSGSAFTAAINFATPHYATSCLDVMY